MKNNKMEIIFFHDVICSFCYPMSYNMRKLVEEVDNIEVKHRSFALMPEKNLFGLIYGSRKKAKDEILTHWERANEIDNFGKFNIEGMRKENFPFPSSMIPLTASKAAGLVGGEDMYWDMFDALQDALYSKNLNIEDKEVLYDLARSIPNMDFEEWKEYFNGDAVKEVEKDLSLTKELQITSAPSLIVNRKYLIPGALPYKDLKEAILKIKEEGVK